jgi:type I restriction enzyme S subunit
LLDLTELRHITDKINVPPSKKLKRGSLLICTASGSKSHLGKVALVDGDYDYAFGGFMGQLTPKPMLNPKYLFYFMISDAYKDHIRALSDGVNINNLRFDDLKPLEVPLPSLPEQQHIVAILDEAFAGLAIATANAEKNLINARDLFESCLHAVFGRLNEDWTVCPLAECVQFVTYGFTNPMPTTVAGPWMVTAKNIVGGEIDYNSARHTSPDAFHNLLTDKSRPKIGDVLLTKDGTLGRLAVVDRDQICINQSVALLRPNGRMISDFIKYLLSSPVY